MANLIFENPDDISRSTSDSPTMHFTVKIKSFSLLAKYSMERYETGEFESGGYKWKLVIYPNGNKDKNVTEHISLYLAIEAADLRPPGWEVHAIFRFFLYDQIRDNYLTIEDASNGYLVDDTCVFGAEVFVSKQRSMDKGECLELIKESITNKFAFRIENYSRLTADDYDSNSFNVGNYKWKIWLSPNGKGIGMGSYNSLNLALANKSNLSAGMKIFAEFTMRILDQINGRHPSAKLSRWFSATDYVHGWDRFISIGSSNLTNMGLLVKDTFVVEAEGWRHAPCASTQLLVVLSVLGTASDSRILKNALSRRDKLKVPQGKYYLVDAGFMLRSTLLAPYRGVRYHLKEFKYVKKRTIDDVVKKDREYWTAVMDDALIDALLHQHHLGNRNGSVFTTHAYDNIVKELQEKFEKPIDKQKVKNRIKTIKSNCLGKSNLG
ncbi:hypothetical protein CMV_011832 [Castanea mollissima]|uniref:MATH domain-containing protein n=1 Tax=Castanea mollissima TaxID=60419 RepID=A0A8J4RJX4_9ROSI|nr:hypothetical protein CMV_011832 [Castanea mollissima]